MKILFVWRKMDQVAGGVERMITALMNDMCQRGHDVSLLTWDQKDANSYYHMDNAITWYCLDMGDPMKKASWGARIKRAPKVRNIINKIRPDVIMCFESGVFISMRLFLMGKNIPIIAAERNAPSRLDFSDVRKKKKIFRILMLANKITVQFDRYRKEYPKHLRSRITAIHNPVKPATCFASPGSNKLKKKILLTVTRLAYQKNNDVLIESFASLSPNFPDWELIIAGTGDDEEHIKSMVRKLGIENKVTLLGAVKDVQSLYISSNLFCLPSRWEGFPNALAEAMAHGLPSVGFSECCGVRDLIQDNKTGLLAKGKENKESLTEALTKLMEDDNKRTKMGEAAIESVTQYHPELIFDQWEKLFEETKNYDSGFSASRTRDSRERNPSG